MSKWNKQQFIERLGALFRGVTLDEETAKEVKAIILPSFIPSGVRI